MSSIIKHFNWAIAAILAVGIVVPAYAEGVEIITVAEKEEVVKKDDGSEETRLVPITTVIPGDEVVYTISFENKGDEEASNIAVTDPIPKEMTYVASSAFGPGTDISYSVDDGKTYGQANELVVVDGEGNERPAVAEDYTHIRWVMRASLNPGEKGFARFKARLK